MHTSIVWIWASGTLVDYFNQNVVNEVLNRVLYMYSIYIYRFIPSITRDSATDQTGGETTDVAILYNYQFFFFFFF